MVSVYLWRRFRLPFSWPTIPDHFSTPIFHFRHDCDAVLSSSSGLTLMSRALPRRYDTGPLCRLISLTDPPFRGPWSDYFVADKVSFLCHDGKGVRRRWIHRVLSVLLAHCIEKSHHPVLQYKDLSYSVQYSLLGAEELMQNYKLLLQQNNSIIITVTSHERQAATDHWAIDSLFIS